ncbi:Phosphatidylserine/phosphatidylglycerophosphate/cardiolipin synthase [Streptomyces sp. DvalAA-14]|uniref:phospholipase D family protein n=1 Tax=unclassified Streptomyces TaxID=2593676 RepID=UPI00081BAD0B|nr:MULTISPECIES: phospholipase D family protein [unclassified Streptomyces]MYS22174.1 phospholipase [Streptomyces sp. SID4948]SCE10187.1 Phosphatidylserine/phosphatidylglycerophosphate/cardiolipin synthase [Streptomyces sp. DvalAA-14]
MGPADWLLTPGERGNPATRLNTRRADGLAWSTGNEVRPLVHGAAYFAELLAAIRGQRAGDLLFFTDWRGDPDETLDGSGAEIGEVLCDAARRGVVVKGLIWRSHLDRLQFSERENRHLGEEIEAAGGECLLDMRVRPGGAHHQKFVVLRHPDRPERDVAFVGGIDLCHSRRDDAGHAGDPRALPMAAAYGPRPPWHDVQLAVRGPAVGDVEATFRERWQDPAPLSRSPLSRLRELVHHEDTRADPLPPQPADPRPRGTQTVQLLRTYPARRHGYPFAPDGERSVARGYRKALARARSLIYLEDQYLWSAEIVAGFAEALTARPSLRMIAVVPAHPDQDGRLTGPMNVLGRIEAVRALQRAGGERFAVYSPENHAGTPVYVHAKVCVIDDVWASVGSDNVNRRSWTHDSELGCAVLDETPDIREPRDPGGLGDGARAFARDLRLELAAEHLDHDAPDALCDPRTAFRAFAEQAAALDAWHRGGQAGPRPPGRLRTYAVPELSRAASAASRPLQRLVADPDGRPRSLRRRARY